MEPEDHTDIGPLLEKSSRATVDFLMADLDLGFTYCETARIELDLDPEAVGGILQKIRLVIDAVEKFLPRVNDEASRVNIEARKERLRRELSELERVG